MSISNAINIHAPHFTGFARTPRLAFAMMSTDNHTIGRVVSIIGANGIRYVGRVAGVDEQMNRYFVTAHSG